MSIDTAFETAPPFCGKCGYDMAGLDVPGTCPECGTRVEPATGLPRSPAPPLPRWIRASIFVWSTAAVIVAIEVKAEVTRRSGAFGRIAPWLWPWTGVIALTACLLAAVVARRGRIEVAAALVSGLVLYAFVLVWMRIMG